MFKLPDYSIVGPTTVSGPLPDSVESFRGLEARVAFLLGSYVTSPILSVLSDPVVCSIEVSDRTLSRFDPSPIKAIVSFSVPTFTVPLTRRLLETSSDFRIQVYLGSSVKPMFSSDVLSLADQSLRVLRQFSLVPVSSSISRGLELVTRIELLPSGSMVPRSGGLSSLDCARCLPSKPGRRSCAWCGASGGLNCSECKGESLLGCSDCKGSGFQALFVTAVTANAGGAPVVSRGRCNGCCGQGLVPCVACAGLGTVRCQACGGLGDQRCGCSLTRSIEMNFL